MPKKSTSPFKTCPACHEDIHRDDYGRNRLCRRCYRNFQLLTDYRISLDEWESVLEQQGDVCGVCKYPPTEQNRLVTDGNKETHEFYGIVCLQCLSCVTAERIYDRVPTREEQVNDYLAQNRLKIATP